MSWARKANDEDTSIYLSPLAVRCDERYYHRSYL